jgi:L-fuconolactonase
MMRIDAHQHFWRIADPNRSWPPPGLPALHRDFLPGELAPLLQRHGIARTVLVQSLPDEDETRFMLDLARRHDFIGGVVGWVDLKRGDAPQRIAALARDARFKGLRPMLQDLDDDCWIDDPALAPAVHAMLAHGLSLDALVLPRHLPALRRFAERFPGLPIVIDHGAKPGIAHGAIEPWRTQLARLAALPSVHCKLSGLVTDAGAGWNLARLQPYADCILELFGPGRVMWGSDWPVLDLVSDYGQWIAAGETLLANCDEAGRRAVFGLNAQAFYRIDKGEREWEMERT